MNNPVLILSLEDNPRDAELVRDKLQQTGMACELRFASDRAEYEAALAQTRFDLIISDYSLPDYDGMAALALARAKQPDVPFILISGALGDEQAVDCVLRGATDYVLKQRLDRLVPAVLRALTEAEERRKRREAEEALRESEGRFRHVSSAISDIAYSCAAGPDDGYSIDWMIGAAERVTGYSVDEIKTRGGWSFLVLEEDLPLLEKHVIGLSPGASGACELRLRHKNGGIVWVASFAECVKKQEHAERQYLYGGLVDITKRKLDEEALRISQEQLHQAQKMEAIGQLAGGMAHDFNNLLTAITCFSDLILSRTDVNPEIGSDVEHIKKAAFRAATLSRQLLVFTRKQALKLTVLDLNKVVADLSKMLRRVIGEDIEISTDLEPGLKHVKADRSQLEQIIMNLAVNARDAMPTGGKLILRTKNVILGKEDSAIFPEAQPGPFVCLWVEDTGQGMDDKTKNHLFEPFFTTKAPGAGTGLGLATVYGIVKQHGGLINVYSEIGQGSVFKIFLPAYSLEPEAADSAEEALSDQFKGRNERILFVEDEESIRNIIVRVLRENRYRVWEAKTTGEAIELFHANRGEFDLVFSDVILPVQSGVSLIAQLLSLKPDLKVLFTSGYIDLKEHADFIADNRYPMLEKPYSIATLLRTVRELLDKQEKAPAGKEDGMGGRPNDR